MFQSPKLMPATMHSLSNKGLSENGLIKRKASNRQKDPASKDPTSAAQLKQARSLFPLLLHGYKVVEHNQKYIHGTISLILLILFSGRPKPFQSTISCFSKHSHGLGDHIWQRWESKECKKKCKESSSLQEAGMFLPFSSIPLQFLQPMLLKERMWLKKAGLGLRGALLSSVQMSRVMESY